MNTFFVQVLAPALKILALCGALAGVVLGACLLFRTQATLGAMRRLNRWVSSRRALKPLEVPRGAGQPVGHGLWLGLILAGAGAYVLIVLVSNFDTARVTSGLLGQSSPVARMIVDAARWVLVAGAALCIAVGLLMALAPRTLQAFEAWGNRWVSTRQAIQGGDQMYLPLDRVVERFPRAAGALIVVLSLAAVAASATLLLPR